MIEQVAYDIPAKIMAGLISGELSRFGSVVRNGSRIIAHLKEVPLPVKNEEFHLKRVAQNIQNAKLPASVMVISLSAIAVGSLAIWAARSAKRKNKAEIPECVRSYQASLKTYLKAINDGALNAGIVDRLIRDLDLIKSNVDNGTISVDLSTEQSSELASLVLDYTRKLTQANPFSPSELEELTPGSADSPIVDLRRYLERQRQLFNRAA